MIDLSTFRDLVAIASFLVALTYYIINIRNQRETRQAQLFMNIYSKIETSDNTERAQEILFKFQLKSAEEFYEKYGMENNPEAYFKWMYLNDLLEGVGVFVREGLVDIRLVALLMSGLITNYWRKYEIVWNYFREKHGWPRAAVEVEYLYHRLLEYSEKHPELDIK